VGYFNGSDTPIPVEEIAVLAGLNLTDAREGLRNLGRANPQYIEHMHDGSPDFYPMLVTGLAKRAWLTVYEIDESIVGSARRLIFQQLDETEFEEFCFDLLVALGFVNVDWRKGTGLRSSPSDSGRDIVAQLRQVDIDGSERLETWFVDCKHYQRGVPAMELERLLAWSQAERPEVALFVVSGFLSNPAKDYLSIWEQQNRPPFRIRYWERPYLAKLARTKADLLAKYPIEGPRSMKEILEAEQEFLDKVWYVRSLIHEERERERNGGWQVSVRRTAEKARERIRQQYFTDNVGPWDDFEWGMVNGKLSALRWVLGDEWDFLDT
jgi:Restriction endonuclease